MQAPAPAPESTHVCCPEIFLDHCVAATAEAVCTNRNTNQEPSTALHTTAKRSHFSGSFRPRDGHIEHRGWRNWLASAGSLEPLQLVEGLGELAAQMRLIARQLLEIFGVRQQPLTAHPLQLLSHPLRFLIQLQSGA